MSFKWSLKQVKVKDIKLNPDNPKIRNEKGFERLRKSLEKFGHIFDGIMNTDNNLIDGHSRIELMKLTDFATVFVPDKKLNKKQYNELAAVFDIATAGEPDYEIIMEILGEEGAEAWGIDYNDMSEEDVDKFFEGEEGQKEGKNSIILTFSKTMYKKVNKELEKIDETKEELFLQAIGLR